MYNRRYTVTAADLNAADPVIIDSIEMDHDILDPRGRPLKERWLPTEFQIINDTGGEVEVNFFRDNVEYKHYISAPNDHALMRLPNGFYMEDDNTRPGLMTRVVIKGNSGHTKDLQIELLNYGRYNTPKFQPV